MPAASYWQALAWIHSATPKCDRALHRRVKTTMPQRIVELGVGDLSRATRVIAMAQRYRKDTIHYCGIDLFDARSEDASLKLKDAHIRLSQTGARIRLVPGDLMSAIPRTANMLTNTDLLIVDATHSASELESIRPFIPRMLGPCASIARYDVNNGKLQLRWMKPDSFQLPCRRAA